MNLSSERGISFGGNGTNLCRLVMMETDRMNACCIKNTNRARLPEILIREKLGHEGDSIHSEHGECVGEFGEKSERGVSWNNSF